MENEIVSQLIMFKNIHNEMEGIQNEIKKLKLKMKPRLDELKNQRQKLEQQLILYLEKNNEPGIQYQDQLFILSDKSNGKGAKTRVNKEEALVALFKKYNVQNPTIAVEEIRKIFPIRNIKKDSDDTKTIVIKKK